MLNNKVNIIDSIMGSGKTSWAIQFMGQSPLDQKFIYITPFLSEVERIKKSVTGKTFYEPMQKGQGKLGDLKQMIKQQKNIVSTHALFQSVDEEFVELVKEHNYTLILDEVMNVIEEYNLRQDDFKLLLDSGMVAVNEDTGIITWNDETGYKNTSYDGLKNLIKSENLYYFEDTILFWTFPVKVFDAFNEVFVLTYLFEGQIQKYYFDMYSVDYNLLAVQVDEDGMYYLIDHKIKAHYDKEWLKSLIELYNGKLNDIGEEKFSLSLSWYEKDSNYLLVGNMKRNLYTYFRNNIKTAAKLNMWTSYKVHKCLLKGKGYGGTVNNPCFVSHNTRATNDFQHKQSLTYTINRFMKPHIYKFFKSNGVKVNQDQWALSELIQWIWRSRIRNGESISIYIPSKRMRRLLLDYLSNDL